MVEESEIEERIHQKLNAVVLISDNAESKFKKHAKNLFTSDIHDCFTHAGIISYRPRGTETSRSHLVFCPENTELFFPTNFIFKTYQTNLLYERVNNPDLICFVPTTLKEVKLLKKLIKHNWNIELQFLSQNYELSQCFAGVRYAIMEHVKKRGHLKEYQPF